MNTTKPTKLVILLESLMHGGVQQGALLLAPRLPREKYEVEVWVLRNKKRYWRMAPEFEKAGVKVRAFPIQGFRDRFGILQLARGLAQEKVVLLNTRSFYANILGRIAAGLAGTPAIIANYHHTYEHRWKNHYIAQERLLRTGTQRFVCVSRAVEQHLTSLLELPPDRTLTLHNGLDISRYELQESKEETRRRLQFPEKAPLIANIGRITAVKDLPTFLKAAAMVVERMPEARFVVVGDGDQADAIQTTAREMGLDRAVNFLGARDDVPAILHACDLVVSTSLMEGLPRIALEAFSSGRAMITTPAGGVPEIIENDRNGLIVPFGDPRACADAIIACIADPTRPARLAATARSDVGRFSIDHWVKQTDDIFQSVIAERSREITRIESRAVPSNFRMHLDLTLFRLKTWMEARQTKARAK